MVNPACLRALEVRGPGEGETRGAAVDAAGNAAAKETYAFQPEIRAVLEAVRGPADFCANRSE